MKTTLLLFAAFLLYGPFAFGQSINAAMPLESDSSSTSGKQYASNKVLNQSPFKIINIGYEYHGAHDLQVNPAASGLHNDYRVNQVAGLRAAVQFPVVNTKKMILTVRAQFQNSNYDIEESGSGNAAFNPALAKLNADGLQTSGLILTLFKPLNAKHIIIAQFESMLSGSYASWGDISSEGLTLGGSVFFTWKLSDRTIIGPGVGRTYRMGRPIIVPLLYCNHTFNNKWGVELALPARGYLRRNIDQRSLMMLGYEIEGNQHEMMVDNNLLYLQRGEIKTRLQYERQVVKSVWLSAQAGIRLNGRFDFVNTYDSKEQADIVYRTIPGNPWYFNLSLNLVSL